MKVNHVHVGVRDLPAAIGWMQRIWDQKPAFYKEDRMATFQFESFILILDAAQIDCPVTVGFETDNCDFDYSSAIQKGASSIKPPENMPWGARTAYIQGPGAIVFEFESSVQAS
ncbi:MAG TPA: hypothetical protein VGT03_10385 [Candidatus Acidoferrales bacterium]|nr:hypothetical protein [Candidatus Acidoferrales bacterium]